MWYGSADPDPYKNVTDQEHCQIEYSNFREPQLVLKKPSNLLSSVADPGSGAFLTRDPGWVKTMDPDPGSGMKTRIIFPRA